MIFLYFSVIALILLAFYMFGRKRKGLGSTKKYVHFVPEWRNTLNSMVRYYSNLSPEMKQRFEDLVVKFLTYTKVTGIGFEVNDTDRLLVASSAVIPVMGIPEFYSYPNVNEVLLYPDRFNPHNYDTEGNDRNVLGMVGTGVMNGKMILSKVALYQGYEQQGTSNVGIHEFVHLIDMADGETDGCPAALLDHQCSIPWLDLVRRKIRKIQNGQTDINPYGATNKVEFFAVASEYFFQDPAAVKLKYPELYRYLSDFFRQKL